MSIKKARMTSIQPIKDTPLLALHTSIYISVVKGRNRNPRNGNQKPLNASRRELANSHMKNIINLGDIASSKARIMNNILRYYHEIRVYCRI